MFACMTRMEPIGHVRLVYSINRPVFKDEQGQWVFDDRANEIRGVWFIPREE